MVPDSLPKAAWLANCTEGLQALGFTEYEARTYLALLQTHPATAYEVSKIGGLPRANAYSAMESLTKKMAVQPVSENPVRYVPVRPEALLNQIAAQTSDLCLDLGRKLSQVESADGTEYVWLVHGEAGVYSKIEEMIDAARRHIWIKAPERILERHLEALKRAADRMVEIVIIFFGNASALNSFRLGPTVTVHLHEGNGIVIALGNDLAMLTTDFEEALVVNTGDGGHGAHTRSWPVVYTADSLIRHEVYLAEIFRQFGSEIEEEFGRALLSIRRKYLPEEHVRALEKRLRLIGAAEADESAEE